MSESVQTAEPSAGLKTLYEQLSQWIRFGTAAKLVDDYFTGERPQQDVERFRIRQKPFKKLADEVVPVIGYLHEIGFKGWLRFPFDNSTPDCWIKHQESDKPQGIEVTVAKARERVQLGRELNETGQGRGYLGLPDNAPEAAFRAKLKTRRVMYTSQAALSSIGEAIKACLSKKTHNRYVGLDLVIDAPLRSLPAERWKLIEPELRAAAEPTTFNRVYIVGDSQLRTGFYIKNS